MKVLRGLIMNEPIPPIAGYKGTGCCSGCSGKRMSGFGASSGRRGAYWNPRSDLWALQGYGGFGAIPANPRDYVLSQNSANSHETDGLVNNPDGLAQITNFSNRWNELVSLSTELDGVREEPEAARASQLEESLAASVLTALMQARNYYPWGSAWGRSESQQRGLTAALDSLATNMGKYKSEVGAALKTAKVAIASRKAAEAAKVEAEAKARAAQAAAAGNVAAASAAQAAAVAAAAKTEQLAQELQFAKLAKEAATVKIFGLPATAVIPAGLAVLGTLGFVIYKATKRK